MYSELISLEFIGIANVVSTKSNSGFFSFQKMKYSYNEYIKIKLIESKDSKVIKNNIYPWKRNSIKGIIFQLSL